MVTQMDEMSNNGTDISRWMKTGKTILCQKDPDKENAVNNIRSIYAFLSWEASDWDIS